MLDWAFTLSSSRKALRMRADSLEMIARSSAAVFAARTCRMKSRVVFFTNGILILFIPLTNVMNQKTWKERSNLWKTAGLEYLFIKAL